MAKKTDADREMELVATLIDKHGYLLHDAKESERFSSVINFKTGAVRTVRVIRFSLPTDSALAKAMDVAAKKSKALAKKQVAASRARVRKAVR